MANGASNDLQFLDPRNGDVLIADLGIWPREGPFAPRPRSLRNSPPRRGLAGSRDVRVLAARH